MRKVKLDQRQLNLNGKHQPLICADYSNFWVERKMNTLNKNTDTLLVASYRVGLKEYAKETEYKFI
jgi:uncharacterized protein (UPF0303 family)